MDRELIKEISEQTDQIVRKCQEILYSFALSTEKDQPDVIKEQFQKMVPHFYMLSTLVKALEMDSEESENWKKITIAQRIADRVATILSEILIKSKDQKMDSYEEAIKLLISRLSPEEMEEIKK